MTRLTQIFGLFLLTLSLTACAQSQPPPPTDGARGPGGAPSESVERQITSLDEAVDLTDAQTTQIRTLLEEQAANQPTRGARGSGNREEMRAQRQAQQAEMNSAIEAILNPDQIEGFRTWSAAQQQRGRRGGQGRRGNG